MTPETVDQVRLNMTHCGECGGPMMAVGERLAFCIRGSCSMCGRGVDDRPLPRLERKVEWWKERP